MFLKLLTLLKATMSRIETSVHSVYIGKHSMNITIIRRFDPQGELHSKACAPGKMIIRWESSKRYETLKDKNKLPDPSNLRSYSLVTGVDFIFFKHGKELYEISHSNADDFDDAGCQISLNFKPTKVRYYINRDGIETVYDKKGQQVDEPFVRHPDLEEFAGDMAEGSDD